MVYFIYVIIIVAFIDTFAQLPIISPYAQSLGATPLLIGLVVGVYSFSNMVGNIFAGFLIDRDGAKRVLTLGLLVTGLILLAYVPATSPSQLVLVRFLHGVSGGFLVPAAFTLLANRSTSDKKGRTMAFSGAAVGLSAIIGPAFGGIMTATAGIKWVFISIGLLMIITTVFAHFLLPGTETIMTRRLDNQQSDASLLSLFTKLPLFYAYLGSFALMFSQGVLAYMLPLKVQALQYGSEMSGLLLSTFSLTAILIFVLPTNKLFDRFTHEKTMTLGLAVLGVALLLVSLTDHHTLLFAIMILYGIGFAFIFPSINALIAQYTSNRERGKAFGLFYAFFSLGVVVGSLVIGALELSPNGAFMLGACVVFVCSLIVLIFILRAQPKEPINR